MANLCVRFLYSCWLGIKKV